jgi:hypothetical protein
MRSISDGRLMVAPPLWMPIASGLRPGVDARQDLAVTCSIGCVPSRRATIPARS